VPYLYVGYFHILRIRRVWSDMMRFIVAMVVMLVVVVMMMVV